jgi:hypothetical protein
MLYLIGLGLASEKDITVAGLEVVKSATRVYLEAYTSILLVDVEKLVSPSFLPSFPAIYLDIGARLMKTPCSCLEFRNRSMAVKS